MDSLKTARRWIKNLKYSKTENVVRNATCDNTSPITKQQLEAFKNGVTSCSLEENHKIFNLWKKRIMDYRCYNHVYKALQVLEYLLNELSSSMDLDFFLDLKKDLSIIQKLSKYRFYDENDVEIAHPVRVLATDLQRKLEVEIASSMTSMEDIIIHAGDLEEDDLKMGSEAAMYFDDIMEEYEGFQIIGCLSSSAEYINGTYQPNGDFIGGRPVFEREGNTEDPIMFWYWEKHEAWMICKESLIGSQVAYALVKTDVFHPVEIQTPFLVYDLGTEKFDVEETMKAVPIN